MKQSKKEKSSPPEKEGEIKKTESKEKSGLTEKLVTDQKEKEGLPLFPPPGKNEDISSGLQMEESEETGESDFEAIDIEEFCKDVVNIPFEIWHILNKNVQPLNAVEKKLISRPLSRLVKKYNLGDYAKDEIVLIAFLGTSIYSRLQKPKPEEVK